MLSEFIELLKVALEKENGNISSNDRFRDYEEWDSLAVLSIIAMIKQNYDITIPRKDFETLITVQELFDYIQQQKE